MNETSTNGPDGIDPYHDLLRISDEPSICLLQHDPISLPKDEAEYALSFAAALLHYADAPACFLMVRGLAAAARFPSQGDGFTDAEHTALAMATLGEKERAELREMLEQEAQSAARLNSVSSMVTWDVLWDFLRTMSVADRLGELGIRVQLTRAGGYRAAVRANGRVFDMPGGSPEEAAIKAMILAQLAAAAPIFCL